MQVPRRRPREHLPAGPAQKSLCPLVLLPDMPPVVAGRGEAPAVAIVFLAPDLAGEGDLQLGGLITRLGHGRRRRERTVVKLTAEEGI